MVSACRRRLATGEMNGTFLARALATLRAAIEASIALLAVSSASPTGCDNAGLRWAAAAG